MVHWSTVKLLRNRNNFIQACQCQSGKIECFEWKYSVIALKKRRRKQSIEWILPFPRGEKTFIGPLFWRLDDNLYRKSKKSPNNPKVYSIFNYPHIQYEESRVTPWFIKISRSIINIYRAKARKVNTMVLSK